MKFTATQFNLFEALSLASRAVPSNPSHPILENLLMRLKGDRLTLIAFDLSLGLKTSIEVQGKEDGAIAVPSKTLSDIISRLPDGDVKIETGENNVLHIKAGKSKYKLSWLVPDEYPELPRCEEEQSLTLKALELATAIRNVGFAAADNETKQLLAGIHFRLVDGLELAAVDGHRMATTFIQLPELAEAASESEPPQEGKPNVELTIPAKSLSQLTRLAKGLADDTEIQITFDQLRAVFKIGDLLLTTRVLQGTYPAYEQLIPRQFERMVTVSRKELIAALGRLSVLVPENKKKSLIVKFNITSSVMTLISEGKYSESGEEEVNCLNSGDDILMAFDAKYMIDALKALSGDEVVININKPLTPVTITPLSGAKHLCLVMPVKI